MIKSFKHKGLIKFYNTGNLSGIMPEHAKKIRMILARLDASQSKDDMDLPGLKLHKLAKKNKLDLKDHYGVWVSGNWRITFRFEGNHIVEVNYLDYH